MYGFRAALILRALPDRRPNNAPPGQPRIERHPGVKNRKRRFANIPHIILTAP